MAHGPYTAHIAEQAPIEQLQTYYTIYHIHLLHESHNLMPARYLSTYIASCGAAAKCLRDRNQPRFTTCYDL